MDFLKLPETDPPGEYVDGKVVQKVSPKRRHSQLEAHLVEEINRVARRGRQGEAVPELRCTFAGRSLVFDVAYFRSDRILYGPDDTLLDDVLLPPDLAIEILSPGQPLRYVENNLRFSVKNGVRRAWLVDPYRQIVKQYVPPARPRLLSSGDTLDADDVLRGFHLPVATVFGWLRRPQ